MEGGDNCEKQTGFKSKCWNRKTYRLSLEYVGALCRGIDFKDILVMTFTKKATAEIKERIFKFLKELEENTKDGEITIKNFDFDAYRLLVFTGFEQ